MQIPKITIILALLLLVIAGYAYSQAYTLKSNSNAYKTELLSQEVELSDILERLFEAVDRGDVISDIRASMPDCAFRTRFDALISKGGTYSVADAREVNLLMDDCASYFVEKKTLTLLMIEDSLARYARIAELLGDTERISRVALLNDVRILEDERLSLMQNQVSLQRDLIEAQTINTSSTRSVLDILEESRNLAERTAVLDKQIDAKRNEIVFE